MQFVWMKWNFKYPLCNRNIHTEIIGFGPSFLSVEDWAGILLLAWAVRCGCSPTLYKVDHH